MNERKIKLIQNSKMAIERAATDRTTVHGKVYDDDDDDYYYGRCRRRRRRCIQLTFLFRSRFNLVSRCRRYLAARRA